MKRKLKNSITILFILILVSALFTTSALAENKKNDNQSISNSTSFISNSVDAKTTNVNVEFSSQCQTGFKVNSLTASRSGNSIIFQINYESNRNCDYSIFNPPQGELFSKIISNGIKSGANTANLTLTLEDFNQMLKCEEITLHFGFDESGSYIFFKTDQLKPLLNGEIIGDKVYPSTIYINKPSVNFTVGKSEKLIPSLLPTNVTENSITWNSSDTNIVSVDADGNILGLKVGYATVTATTANSLTATCKVTVSPNNDYSSDINIEFTGGYQEGFTINSLSAKRNTDTIVLTLDYESTDIFNYSLFDPTDEASFMKIVTNGIKVGNNTTEIKLTIDEFNKILDRKEIRMRFYSDKLTAGWVNFETTQLQSLLNTDPGSEKISPTSITLNKTAANLAVNGSEKLTATLSPANTTETSITWSSSDPSITTVDSNGNVTGIKAGTAAITATTANNLSSVCQITVASNAIKKSISYQTHVQDVGWQDWKTNGTMSGTSARSLRLEGIKIKLNNYENLGVQYQTHIQNIGWEAETNRGWKSNGDMSGTEALSYRLEAIQIKLTGTDADKYDIYYHVHAQNIGWMGWAKNGESAGTAGYGYRLEGIEIKVVPKSDPAPSDNVTYANPFKENIEAPYSQIMQEYRVAEANGFSSDILKNLPNVNDELLNYKGNNGQLFYTVQDISGDSTPELLIGTYSSTSTWGYSYGYKIYDIYRLSNGVPERIFDIQSMGYRAIYTVCENQMIKMYGSGGSQNYVYKFFKLNGNTATTYQEIEYDGRNGVNFYLTDAQNNERKITEEKANIIINSYIPRSDLNWIKL